MYIAMQSREQVHTWSREQAHGNRHIEAYRKGTGTRGTHTWYGTAHVMPAGRVHWQQCPVELDPLPCGGEQLVHVLRGPVGDVARGSCVNRGTSKLSPWPLVATNAERALTRMWSEPSMAATEPLGAA